MVVNPYLLGLVILLSGFNNGLIIQWGNSANNTDDAYYPITFPSKVCGTIAQMIGNNAARYLSVTYPREVNKLHVYRSDSWGWSYIVTGY